jgi:hypothetical protein
LQFKSCSLQKWNLPLHWVLAFLGSSSGPWFFLVIQSPCFFLGWSLVTL